MMPLEERLRTAFAEETAEVRPDVEQQLMAVHRRRTRRRVALGGGVAAAVTAIALGVALLVPGEDPAPRPTTPPPSERVSDPGETVPLGTYVRRVTAAEALAAGFPRGEVRWLFDGAESVRLEMLFREKDNPWVLTFVDEDGDRQVWDGGDFYYGSAGELLIISRGKDCLGCTARYVWHLTGAGRLKLAPMPGTVGRPVVELLTGGVWRRQAS